jgi:hypothetical protein
MSFIDLMSLSLRTAIRNGSVTRRASQSNFSTSYCFSVWLKAPIWLLVTEPIV